MRIALLLITSLFLCGCRVSPNAEREIALLRAEILDLEDQYYSLKSQCQGGIITDFNISESAYVNGDIVYDQPQVIYDDQYYDPITGESLDGGAVIGQGVKSMQLNTDDQIRSFESGSPVIESNSEMESIPAVEGIEPFDDQGSTSILNRRLNVSQSDNRMRAIRINQQLSKGEDLDGAAGHEGISLLVQPINVAGQVVNNVGQMTVQLLESDRLASSRQIGFWRFTSEEIQNFQVREDLVDQGILLHLPWGPVLPTKNTVSVVVNFVSSDNVRHNNRLQIPIQPPAKRYSLDEPVIANWIENDHRWRDIETTRQLGPEDINPGLEFNQPEFQNVSDPNAFEGPSFEPESDRRTSIPRWRPVR